MTAQARIRKKLGYEEYVNFPDDGNRHEIIDGDHFVNPAPSTYHQTLSKRLQYQLYSQIELRGRGLVFNAPIDVQLSDHDIVQPDLVVILNAKTMIVTPSKIQGVPDLIVEITSPSSAGNDRTLKRRVYERAGITEYWLVDPLEHRFEQLVLREAQYVTQSIADEVRPTIADGVVVRLADVW